MGSPGMGESLLFTSSEAGSGGSYVSERLPRVQARVGEEDEYCLYGCI